MFQNVPVVVAENGSSGDHVILKEMRSMISGFMILVHSLFGCFYLLKCVFGASYLDGKIALTIHCYLVCPDQEKSKKIVAAQAYFS